MFESNKRPEKTATGLTKQSNQVLAILSIVNSKNIRLSDFFQKAYLIPYEDQAIVHELSLYERPALERAKVVIEEEVESNRLVATILVVLGVVMGYVFKGSQLCVMVFVCVVGLYALILYRFRKTNNSLCFLKQALAIISTFE